eukprot:scaffold4463_cov51-Attheya_sp.AAC.10
MGKKNKGKRKSVPPEEGGGEDTTNATHDKKAASGPLNKKRSTIESLPWNSVSVGLAPPKEDEDEFLHGKNHYDDEDTEQDPSDLYTPMGDVTGAADPGIFLGLEVLDGNSYEVERRELKGGGCVTRVIMKDEKSSKQTPASTTPDASTQTNHKKSPKEATSLSKKEKLREKRKRKRKEAHLKRQDAKLEKQQASDTEASSSLASGDDDSKPLTKDVPMESDETAKSAPSDIPKATKKPDHTEKKKKPKNKKATKEDVSSVSEEEVVKLQTTWSIQASGIYLRDEICASLHRAAYHYPTPIQAKTLSASILGRRNIVGAAPTGSGKTLAYALPILQFLLENASAEAALTDNVVVQKISTLQALILCPTRELALQVSAEFDKIAKGTNTYCATIVGGLAEVKQRRILEGKKRPEIIVATPGRLWEMMSTNDYDHLNNLSQLRFLVIDEADRMVNQGSFPQLTKIFDRINTANPVPEEEDSSDDESDEDDDDPERLRSLKGVRGEAKVQMLDDSILEMIDNQRQAQALDASDDEDESRASPTPPIPVELGDEEFEAQQRLLEEQEDGDNQALDESDEEKVEPVHRQTFVFSATLTLPSSDSYVKKSVSKRGKNNKNRNLTVEGAVAEILEKAGCRGETKVVDLTTAAPERSVKENVKDVKESKAGTKSDAPARLSTRLPPGLSLYQIKCIQKHKDSHLYGYLTTTKQGSSGPVLVFCNSIAAVRRVGETLRILGLPVKMIHAQMAQKARFGALESLRELKSRCIVVATDVAARGLDIPSVSTVIHYDVARAVDTFIHRAGRTARGVGDKAIGASLSLISPSEEKAHYKICERIEDPGSKLFQESPIDGRLLSAAQERVALATKIVECEDVESKVHKKNQWFKDAASEIGVDLDEDLLEDGLIGGDQRDRQKLVVARNARGELRDLLKRPMRKQNFGKFLSSAGLSESIRAEAEVTPYVVDTSAAMTSASRRKKKRKTK